MKQQNSIDYISISLAILELNKISETKLATKLENILRNNELPKPDKHNKKDDYTTSYYTLTLNAEELEKVVNLFLDLEVGSLDEKYNSTVTTSRYSDMVCILSSIIPIK